MIANFAGKQIHTSPLSFSAEIYFSKVIQLEERKWLCSIILSQTKGSNIQI